MNRTEYFKTLAEIYDDLSNPNGNFQCSYPTTGNDLEEAKKYAAVSLMVVDRYYSNLTKQFSERKDLLEA